MRAILLIIFTSFIILPGSCSHRLPDKKVFDKVDIGMTVEEIKKKLGTPADISLDVGSSVSDFYGVHNDVWTRDYAAVYFDKSGRVSVTSYESHS